MVIYLTTHIPSGKKYIGKDKNNSSKYYGSGTEIKKIIEKEGIHNLKKEILEECLNPSHLAEREEYWLNYFNVENNKNFLNKTNKSFGNSGQTEDGKNKISKALKGKKRSDEIKEKISKSKIGVKRGNYVIRKDKGIKRGKNKLLSFYHSTRDRSSSYKPVFQYDLNGNFIKEYTSAKDAKEKTGFKIQNALTGRVKFCGGYIWKYKK
jgi:hypothetical protein